VIYVIRVHLIPVYIERFILFGYSCYFRDYHDGDDYDNDNDEICVFV
jgi:hypothetical protein